MTHTVEIEINGLRMAIETGKVAKQADGAVVVRYGGSMVLAARLAANPTTAQQKASGLELVIAATEDAVLMVESGANEIPEETMLEAIAFGHAECKRLARAQRELAQRAAKPRWTFDASAGRDAELQTRVKSLAASKLAAALATHDKQGRADAVNRVFDEVMQSLGVDETKRPAVREAFETVEKAEVRRLIVERGLRVDGRKVNEVRPISIDLAYLPRAHGSSLLPPRE